MQAHDFSSLLDFLCGGILSKREREAVRSELESHLQDKYEALLRKGLTEEEAEKEAEASFGDRQALRAQLVSLHPYAPKPSLKKAMQLLIFGFLLRALYVELFSGMRLLFSFAGGLLFLTGLFCLATADHALKRAFVFRLCGLGAAMAGYALAPIFEANEWLRVLFGLPAIALNTFSWVFMFRGLQKLSAVYAADAQKPLRFSLVKCLWAVGATLLPLCTLLFTGGGTAAFTLQSGSLLPAVLFYGLTAAYIICTEQLFLRLDRLLYRSDHDYKIEADAKTKAGFFTVAAAFAFGMVFAGHYLYVKQPPKPAVYELHDAGFTEEERASLIKTVRNYSMPEVFVSALPESELDRLRTLPPFEAEETQALTGYFSAAGENDVTVTEYVFPLIGENGEPCYRIMRHISILKGEKLRGAYRMEDWRQTDLVPLANSDFLLIIRRQNGKVYSDAPLREYRDFRGILTGFDFQRGDQTDIYYALTYTGSVFPQNVQFKHTVLLTRSIMPGLKQTLDEHLTDSHTVKWNVESFGLITKQRIGETDGG